MGGSRLAYIGTSIPFCLLTLMLTLSALPPPQLPPPYALKLTPLYPHHPLIANRLLREPELLRVIPAHPNLVGVEGWLKTPSHFYLIETFSSDLVPLNEV